MLYSPYVVHGAFITLLPAVAGSMSLAPLRDCKTETSQVLLRPDKNRAFAMHGAACASGLQKRACRLV